MNEPLYNLKMLTRHAVKRSVVRRAFLMSAVVGAILIAINHGNRICDGTFGSTCLIQCVLTLCVPYGVSTVSSVLAEVESESAVHQPRKFG